MAKTPGAGHGTCRETGAHAPVRRGTADPVKLLLHRHRALCAGAVDPLEIAAGLEAHGITDRTALTRFRHRDVFALAEELYARVPHDGHAGPPPPAARHALAPWALTTLLPGPAAALAVAAAARTAGPARIGAVLAGALALSAAVAASLRRGPLRAAGREVPGGGLWTCWLLAFAACGGGVLDALARVSAFHADPAPLVALCCALAPAAWCAHLFSVRAGRRLALSRDLAHFAAGARPLLLVSVALYACALTGIALLVARTTGGGAGPAHVVALGTLLLLARLLAGHGFPGAAAAGLAAACGAEALATASLLAARLPGCAALGAPVARLAVAWGAECVPALACGAAALGLLCRAAVTLARASAHT
ncbi:hypothetical protein AB0910_10320 [Streptomyces sp. NPDC047002]|uniref:hypothetical protein n=1 Tax=Streptomyces sp. NPDC047002 TaxID=3155475 RepID=UPI0034537779